jgi:hypothetical protein
MLIAWVFYPSYFVKYEAPSVSPKDSGRDSGGTEAIHMGAMAPACGRLQRVRTLDRNHSKLG